MKMRSHGNRIEAVLKIESRELFLSFRRRCGRISGTVLKRRQSFRRNQLACLKSMGLINCDLSWRSLVMSLDGYCHEKGTSGDDSLVDD